MNPSPDTSIDTSTFSQSVHTFRDRLSNVIFIIFVQLLVFRMDDLIRHDWLDTEFGNFWISRLE